MGIGRSEWSASRWSRFTPSESVLNSNGIRVCVDPRASLDTMVAQRNRLCRCRDTETRSPIPTRKLGRPFPSQSFCWLSYPNSYAGPRWTTTFKHSKFRLSPVSSFRDKCWTDGQTDTISRFYIHFMRRIKTRILLRYNAARAISAWVVGSWSHCMLVAPSGRDVKLLRG
jgi:hypothetical protein